MAIRLSRSPIPVSSISVGRGPAQTIPDVTQTVFEFNVIVYDNLGEYDNVNYRFVAQNDGYYLAVSHFVFFPSAWAAGDWWDIILFLNGGYYAIFYRHEVEATGTTYQGGGGSVILYLNAGDFLDVRLYHNRGANTDTTAGVADWNYFMVHRLS